MWTGLFRISCNNSRANVTGRVSSIVVVGTILVVIVLMVPGVTFRLKAGGASVTAEAYLRAVAEGEVAVARQMSLGRVAEFASRLEDKDLAAKVEEVKAEVVALSDAWARVEAVVELTLKDGTADVGWYELGLLKEGGVWKVYSFREIGPRIEGSWVGNQKKEDLYEVEAIFKGYMDDLAMGRYKEAARWLAGPALREHLKAEPVLGRGKIVDRVEEVSFRVIGRRGKLMVVEARYRVGGRDVRVAVTAYRTVVGWRMVEIAKV
ncbi:hypothetical protein SAMN00808754_1528 [Thermanaeromonas toyohensis ToBE]|uniref:Uncharacterized protein n=1 Tax=Thermanaeromonas toyohensis ToBE TaxID=698762 RepID=A0A1W1VTG8_9FIRM|nr:hypothetical protein [Thermanaeromonas toyohensis]SMB96530.1 hypothetical protein SAMN00808754_1528 [Thermanaeromonas toyohensis ToBE]